MPHSEMPSTGFFVAQGAGTGPKSETTIVFTKLDGAARHPLAPPLLDQNWLARWRKSAAKFPATISQDEKARFAILIENHQQFSHAG